MDWLAGIAGFLLLEGLKVYRRLWAGGKVLPERQVLWGVTVLWLAALAGLVGHILSEGDVVKALFVGFSVPMGLKGIVVKPPSEGDDLVDDVDMHHEKDRRPNALRKAMNLIEDSLSTI